MRLSILLGACLAAAPSFAQSGWNNTSIQPSGSDVLSSPPSSAPVLSSRPITRTGSAPPTSTSAPPATVTVSNGETVDVAVGVVVFGGAGGGFYTVNGGAAIPIAAGATATAGSQSGNENQEPSEPPTSEPPTSTEPTSSQPTSSQPPTGTPKPYMIFPADGADTAAFLTTLEELVQPEVPQVVDILDTASNTNTTLMWVANLTDTQLRKVEGNSAIEGTMENVNLTAVAPAEEAEGQTVTPPAPGARRRSLKDIARRAVINVDTDDFDLIQLSTAEGSQPGKTYDYDESAGMGVSVYVIESDILMDHQEFTDGGRTTRKLTIPDMTGNGLKDDRAEFHGTCAASKAVGNTAGSAPKADFVAVDMTNADVATLIAAFAMVAQDVAAKGLKGKAVISCSLTASESSITEAGIGRLRRVLGVLVSLDVAIVLSAGNYGGDINTYPPMLADELPLINVGAVDDKGEIASWSQGGPLLTTAAGGVGIVCATHEGVDAYRIQQGTSFAAPLVAGMVAYWLGHPDYTGAFPASQVAQAAKDSVTALHWARVEGGYNVAYNGAHECVEDDSGSEAGSDNGSQAGSDSGFQSANPAPVGRRNVIVEARQAAGNTTLGLGGILAASCPLPPSSSSSSIVITATPTTFATVTSTASATSTVAAETSAPAIEPMYCYSFDPACYGYCCPDEPGGTCSSEFPGKQGCRCGAGGATNVIPDGAQCPMPA